MRGRKPKPSSLKRLAGNPGKRPINTGEPQPGKASARVPHGLTDGAKAFWRKNAQKLIDLGILTKADREAFLMMSEHYSLARQAAAAILDAGSLTTIDKNGNVRKHPLLQVIRDNSMAFKSYAVEFGLTPSSRARLNIVGTEDEPSLAELLFNIATDKE